MNVCQSVTFLFFLSFLFLKSHFIQHCNNLFTLNFTYFFNGSWNPTFYWLKYLNKNGCNLKAEIQATAAEYWNMDQTDMMVFNYWNAKCVLMICVICCKKKMTVPFKTALLHSLSSIYCWPQHVCIFHMLWEHFWTVCSLYSKTHSELHVAWFKKLVSAGTQSSSLSHLHHVMPLW